jgi:hypothetical protein
VDRLTVLTVGIIASVVIGLGGVGLGTAALERPRSTSSSPSVSRLEAEIAALRTELAAAMAEGSRSTAKLTKFSTCVPELMNYVNGLTPEVTGNGFFLSPRSQISSYCSPVFYP